MEIFNLSNVNAKKVFIIHSSQLEGRLDVDFYRPEILELEYKVRKKSSGKFSKFIKKIASGATPDPSHYYGQSIPLNFSNNSAQRLQGLASHLQNVV